MIGPENCFERLVGAGKADQGIGLSRRGLAAASGGPMVKDVRGA